MASTTSRDTITLAIAIIGVVLGVINSVVTWKRGRVSLKVIPKSFVAICQDGTPDPASFHTNRKGGRLPRYHLFAFFPQGAQRATLKVETGQDKRTRVVFRASDAQLRFESYYSGSWITRIAVDAVVTFRRWKARTAEHQLVGPAEFLVVVQGQFRHRIRFRRAEPFSLMRLVKQPASVSSLPS